MNSRHPLFATLLLALPLALAGCGNKGPLVLAEEPAPIEDPATPEGAVPVDIERQETLPADQPVGALPDPTATDSLIGTPATTDPMPPAVDPAPADDAYDDSTDDPEQSTPETPTSGQSFPIDPATVPDSAPDESPDDQPEAETADDDNG